MTEGRMLKGDDGEALHLYWGTDRNNFQSEAQGKPVYDEVLFLEIFTPGQANSTPTYQVIRRYKEDGEPKEIRDPNSFHRYGKFIEAYISNDISADMAGTPLDVLPFMERTQIATLREAKIFTAEGLAAISDEKLRVLGMEGRTLRSKAQAFLDAASGGAAVAKLTQEIADLTEQVGLLKDRAELAETQLAAVAEKKPEEAPKKLETPKEKPKADDII